MTCFIQTESEKEFQWHVGEKVEHSVKNVTCVQADGDELEYIRRHFQNIPMTHSSVVFWVGEVAQFIAINIHLYTQYLKAH